jgi:hypothetical protein
MFQLKRALDMPGYHYFESGAPGAKPMIKELSWYARFRVFCDIIVFEYLCRIFIFRWICNIMRFSMVILDIYPFLALWSFGKKFAYVKIMKSKK